MRSSVLSNVLLAVLVTTSLHPALARNCGQLFVTLTNQTILEACDCTTNHDLGFAMGEVFAKEIKDMVLHKSVLRKIRRYVQTRPGAELMRFLKAKHQKLFADIWSELEGMAEGAGVSVDELFMLNLRHEFAAAMKQPALAAEDACSAVLAASSDAILIGHNEDNPVASVGLNFYVRANVDGVRWMAFVYAGELASSAFGFNSAGLAFTQNAVTPLDVNVRGVGRAFHSRRVLGCNTTDQALETMLDPDAAFGRSWNLADINEKVIYNIETGPNGTHDILQVQDSYVNHFNLYKRLNISQRPDNSSEHRQARADQLPAVHLAHDVLTVLGDDADPVWPIFRRVDARHEWTLATVLIDVMAKKALVYNGNPKVPSNTVLSISLPDVSISGDSCTSSHQEFMRPLDAIGRPKVVQPQIDVQY